METEATLSSSLLSLVPPNEAPSLTRAGAITVAIDPVALVLTECITVTSAMRKHARWAHSSVSAILGGASSRTTSAVKKEKGEKGVSGNATPLEEDEALASRWGLRGKKGKSMQDNPLMSAFSRLRNDLKNCKDIKTYDTPSLLHPFLQVIRSSSTSAPITSLALIAITKFLAYNIISRESPRLSEAMQLLASAITHCRFEASDATTDEIVLLRILRLMEGMIAGPGGDILGDESVCELMETGLSMCCQSRLSELLRRSAEISMVAMCQVIFERLKHLETEAGEDPGALEEETKDDMDTVKMDPIATTPTSVPALDDAIQEQGAEGPGQDGPGSEDPGSEEQKAPVIIEKADGSEETAVSNTNEGAIEGTEKPKPEPEKPTVIKPYSLPSIRELLRVLVDLLDPHDRQHTDTMRIMALRMVDVALAVAGPSIANHPSLAALAKDTLCRHLFQLVRSENMAILNESLRVAGTLLATCRGVLKLQQELFLSYLVVCLFPRVEIPQEPGINPLLYDGVPQAPSLIKPAPSQSSGRSTPVPVKDRQKLGMEGGARKPDAREAMVESIGALVRIPSFMVELFVNYDCEIDRSDLCMDMVGLMSRNAFPDSATWSTTNVPPLCLDALLGYIHFIASRIDEPAVVEGFPDPEILKKQRALKKVITRGATKFNENVKGGIAFLTSQGVIKDPDDPRSIAKFLKGTSRIDKKILGEFLSKKSNGAILNAFLDLFDFSDQRVDEALRQLLNTFRLPGESQLIERIVTEFSDKYCANATPEGIADKDAVYVLTYAIIMLNTDQHNPNLKSTNRMSIEDFSRNLRGVNGGKDFAREYLQDIYDSIRTREIILPEEHQNKNAFDLAWKELLIKIQSSSNLQICKTNIYDADMFAATWKPVIATLSFVFMSATDDAVFSRIVTGFDQCAQIAAKYGKNEALDSLITRLAYISTLATDEPPSTSLNTEVQADKKSVMVSETAVRFGRDYRAQLATIVLFRVINNHENAIKDGWNSIIRVMLNLFVNSLIPSSFFSWAALDLPPIPLQNPAQIIDKGERPSDTGLFSAFTSYVSSFANDEPPEPSDQEIEYTLCTVDTIKECAFEDILNNISHLPVDSLKALLRALLAQIPEDASPRVIVVKSDAPPTNSPARGNGSKTRSNQPAYDPAVVFVLELSTILALRDRETVEELGKDVADALQTVIRDAANIHPVVVSRSVYYLLTLLRASNEFDFIRAPVILHTFSSFDRDILKQSAGPLLKGISMCIKGPWDLRSEMANSPDFWSLLQTLYSFPEAAAETFAVVDDLINSTNPSISADNYEATVRLLNAFATSASVAAADEQKPERHGKRGKAEKPPKSNNEEAVDRGSRAMSMIYQMTTRIPNFIEQSQLESTEAWNAYWSPIFRALTTQCLNPCREIRRQAFTSLQRTLLSKDLASTEHKQWTAIFGEVLFPLITQLLKPEVYKSDPVGMSETRVRAANLLCKTFLHYLTDLAEWEGMLELWTNIITVCDRLKNSGQGDNLEDAVSENLKNILLVMSNGGYLAPPEENPERRALWEETWKRLDRFLPHFFGELFPEEAKKPPAAKEATAEKAKESAKAETEKKVKD